jgi:hypothetical protein
MIERRVLSACLLLVALSSSGCAFLGPRALRGSRGAYNDAIVATNSQQVLSMILRIRYGEPTGLLAVSSITTNLQIGASAGAEFGWGEESNYQGNLVPLSAGFAYEENPTISYTPVQGETYMRELLSPLPIDLTVLLVNALRGTPQSLELLVRSINGLRNPDFLGDPSVGVEPRFTRLVELLAELGRQGHTRWVRQPGEPPSFALVVADGASVQRIGELHDLLGFAAPREIDPVVSLPVELGIGRPEAPAIRLETRSLYDLFGIAAASVEVPEKHLESGWAQRLPPSGPAGRSIRIRRSDRRPKEAIAAVRHHGSWYYVDGTDTASKLTFRILESLISVRIADAVDHEKATPVLTVPVAR